MKKLLTFLALCATAVLGLGQGRNISINPATKKLIYPLPADAAALGEINALAYLKPNDTAAQDTNKTGMLAMMAFAATRSATGGTAFFIPDGIYNINCSFTGTVINVPSNTSIRMGKGTKLVVDLAGDTERYTMFRFSGSSNCRISGGEIVGDKVSILAGSNYGYGITFNAGSNNNTVENVILRDFYTDGWLISQGADIRLNNVESYNNLRHGGAIVDGQRISVNGCVCKGNALSAIDVETEAAADVTDVSFTDCLLDTSGLQQGLYILKGTGAGIPKRISVRDCTITGNGGSGVGISNAEDVTIKGCSFRGNTGANISAIRLVRGEFSGNTTTAGTRGFHILASSDVRVSDNTIISPGDTGIETIDNDVLVPLRNLIIQGNTIQNGANYGIDFRGASSLISDNWVNRVQTGGIRVTNNNNIVARNQVYEAGLATDNTWAAIYVEGTGNQITNNSPRKARMSETGTAQSGGASTITLATTSTASNGALVGYKVTILSGTGSGQTGTITANTGPAVTVSAPWGVAPDATSVYEIIPAGNQQKYGIQNAGAYSYVHDNDTQLSGKTAGYNDSGSNTHFGFDSGGNIGVATGTSLTTSAGLTSNSGTIQGVNIYATTGNYDIGTDARATNAVLRFNTAAGRFRQTTYLTGGVIRWAEGINSDAEGGSDSGSDWRSEAYTDAGVFIDYPVTITRAAGGAMQITRPVVADSFSGDGSNLTSINAANVTGSFGDISMTGSLTREGAQILPATTSGGTVIDTSKARSERTITADTTFTFSAAPPTGSQFSVAFTADSVDRAITIPSSYSFEAGGAVTVFTQRANQHVLLGFIRLASSYQVIGVPVSDILGSTITLAEGGSTATPAAATAKIYVKADGNFYGKDDAGTETALSNVAGGGAPTTATYITQTADAGLSAEQAMGALATGIVKNTTTTGVQSIAVAGTDYAGLASANTFTAAQINSTAGAASTPAEKISGVPFAGTGTTSFPLVYINDASATASTTLSTAGTYFGVNGDGTQDLMSLLKDGTSQFLVKSDGRLATNSHVNLGTDVGLEVYTTLVKAQGRDVSGRDLTLDRAGLHLASGAVVVWSSRAVTAGADTFGATDTALSRNAAGVVEVNNGTPGTFRDLKLRTLISDSTVRLKGFTVAALPAGTVGDTAYVTDATAPTYLGALTGGGAVACPVFYNGAAWVSH